MGQFSMEKPALKGQFSVEINTKRRNRVKGPEFGGFEETPGAQRSPTSFPEETKQFG
jgi:hypothetical protein